MTVPFKPQPAPWLTQWIAAQRPDATRVAPQTPQLPPTPTIGPANARPQPGVQAALAPDPMRGVVDKLETAQTAAEFLPSPFGDVASLGAGVRELRKGNKGMAALSAASALPFITPTMVKSAKRALPTAQLRKAAKAGGFTFDPRSGKMVEGGGFMVGGVPGQKGLAVDELTPAHLKQFAKDNEALLSVDGMMLGGWFDEKSGKYFIDVSERIPDRDAALKLMDERGEAAAFDLDTMSELRNPKVAEGVSAGAAAPEKIMRTGTGHELMLGSDGQAVRAVRGPDGQVVDNRTSPTSTHAPLFEQAGWNPITNEGFDGAHGYLTRNGEFIPSGELGPRGSWHVADAPAAQARPALHDMSPEQLDAYGAEHGVEGLGRQSTPGMLKLTDGREVNIPGGTEGTFSYYDLLTLKSQGINPNLMPDGLHEKVHAKMMRSMRPPEGASDEDIFRMLAFGLTSPNNPLTQNEFTLSRLLPRNMDDIRKLAQADPKTLPHELGIDATGKGGMGTRGTEDYANIVKFAKMFSEDPKWFRRAADEPWDEYTDRIASQVPGLGSKTASLSVVWQDLANAGVSAVDRHMAELAMPHILDHPTLGPDFRARLVKSWNAAPKPNKKTGKVADAREPMASLEAIRERDPIFVRDFLASLINDPKKFNMRDRKGGFGPDVPEYLRKVKWVQEPEQTALMNPYYREALKYNASRQSPTESLFESQWRLWDKQRGRIEPHEIMFPGINKLPRMSLDDAKKGLAAHDEALYLRNQRTMPPDAKIAVGGQLPAVKPVANPMHMGYWGLGGVAGASAAGAARQQRGLLDDES